MSDVPRIQYLNTDLDLQASASLESLFLHLESRGLYRLTATPDDTDKTFATFELDGGFDDEGFDEPCSAIAGMLSAIESASGDARACWDSCTKREFNVGYDCGCEPWEFNQSLSNDILRRMAACGATFRVTLYPLDSSYVTDTNG